MLLERLPQPFFNKVRRDELEVDAVSNASKVDKGPGKVK